MIKIDKNISEKLRIKRAKEKISLIELAKLLKVSSKTLSLIENEKKSKIQRNIYQKIVEWLL